MKRRRRKNGLGFNPLGSEQEQLQDSDSLTSDVTEQFRDPRDIKENAAPSNANWSQEQDRSDDLAEMKDPFIQQPERDTQTPPELAQERQPRPAGQIGGQPPATEDLAHLFDRERKLRKYTS